MTLWDKLISSFLPSSSVSLPEVETLRAGKLEKGKWVVWHGFLGRLDSWDKEKAYIILESGTSLSPTGGYDKTMKGTRMVIGLDSFRASPSDEVLLYTN